MSTSTSTYAAESNGDDHSVALTNYIFNVGYMGQNWADVQLTFFNDALKLHRIILSRSPYLAQYLVNTAPGTTVHLKFRDENITSEAVFTCIHHLYNPAFHLITANNCRAVLATALLFDAQDLVQQAYSVARDAITTDSLLDWVAWLSDSGYIGPAEEWDGDGRYGPWSARLKQDTFDLLTRTPHTELVPIYTHLPFPLLKKSLESPSLDFPSMQARFSFTKQVLASRKKAGHADEHAVLAVTGDDGMQVQVTRRARKNKQLWKVEG